MAFIYCSECGAKLEYKTSKPIFCSACGYKFGEEGVNESEAQAEVGDYSEGRSPGKIKGLEYEVILPQSGQTKLGNLLGTSSEGSSIDRRPAPPNKGGDPIADTIKACASVRGSKKVDE